MTKTVNQYIVRLYRILQELKNKEPAMFRDTLFSLLPSSLTSPTKTPENQAAINSFRALMKKLEISPISSTKRDVLTAVLISIINILENRSVLDTLTTDYHQISQQIVKMMELIDQDDDEFLERMKQIIMKLPEGSDIEVRLTLAVNHAQSALTERRKSVYQWVAGAMFVANAAVLMLADRQTACMVFLVEILAAQCHTTLTKCFNNILENVDAIMSAKTESEVNQQQTPAKTFN